MSAKKQFDTDKFVMRPAWWFRTNLKPTAREVFTVLVSHLRYGAQSGTVFPAVETIAEEANISERAAYTALWELRDAGLITIQKRAGDPHRNEYVIHALSQAQIEALCQRQPEADSPLPPAETDLQNLQAHENEPAKSAGEVEQENENQGTRPNGLAGHTYGVCPADAGPAAEPGSQGLGEAGSTAGADGPTAAPLETAGSTAGPGSTHGPPLATDGLGSTPGSLAKTPGLAGQTAGPTAGQSNDSGTANSKTHWASRERTDSKGQRAKRPFDDPEMESRASLIADCAIENRINKSSREATMTTARHLLMDGKEHDEILAVIRHAGASPDRWKITNLWKLREKYYADILDDLRVSTEWTPEERATLRAKLDAYQDNRPWRDTESGADEDVTLADPDCETGKPIAEYVKPADLGNDAGAVTNAITFPRLRARLERHGDPPAPDHPAKLAEEALQAEQEAERKRAGQERLKARAAEIRGMFAERGSATSTQFTRSPALSSEGSLAATMTMVRPT